MKSRHSYVTLLCCSAPSFSPSYPVLDQLGTIYEDRRYKTKNDNSVTTRVKNQTGLLSQASNQGFPRVTPYLTTNPNSSKYFPKFILNSL